MKVFQLLTFLSLVIFAQHSFAGGPPGGCNEAATIPPGNPPVICSDPVFDAGTGGSVDCNTATPIAMPGCQSCISGTTDNSQDGVTTTYGACGGVDGVVWFTYTVPDAVNEFTLTPGTLVDPFMVISDQPCGSGSFNTCETGAGSGAITDSWGLTPGTQAWIGVGSTSESNGTFELCIESNPAPAVGGNTCETALLICDPTGFNVPLNNSTASGITPGCFLSAPQQDTWITFTVLADGSLDWTGSPDDNAEFDWAMYNLTNTNPCAGTMVACNYNFAGQCGDDFGVGTAGGEFNASFNGVAGETYAIQIDNFSGNGVGFNFNFLGTAVIAPVADFSVNSNISCAGSLNVNFTDNSLGTTVSYDFGNGNTYTGTNPPNQTYTAGTYSVTATATAGACTNIYSDFITVYDPLAATITPTPSPCNTPCEGSVALTNVTGGDGVYTYLWSNGATGSSISNVCPGNYSVTISNATCGTSLTLNATVGVIDDQAPTASDPNAITVNCASDVPAPDPLVVTDETDNVDTNLDVVWVSDVTDNGSCPEVITRTYRVTDDCGLFVDVTQTITISGGTTLILPASTTSTVACPSDAVDPGPPGDILDPCGNTISPVLVGSTQTPNPVVCEGTIVWTYRYTACDGVTTADWTHTYTIDIPPFTITDADGAITVNCIADADGSGIVLPTVQDECGNTLTASAPVITDSPDPITCEGTRTYTYTYTDCAGNSDTWSFVYTIDVPPFTITNADGALTVNCLVDADGTGIVLPTVQDECGNTLTASAPVITDSPDPITCEGTRTYTYTYTDCAGNSDTWSYVYTIDVPPFTITNADGALTVNCVADADGSGIVLPTVQDECGNTLTASAPVITDSPDPLTCEGTRTYTYTYTDCAGNSDTWSYVYTIDVPAFTITDTDGALTVNCLADADGSGIVLPTVQDECGNTLTASAPVITDSPDPLTCEGTRTYTYTFTDCAGNSDTWSYVYTIDVPVFTITDIDGALTVNCIADADGSGIILPTVLDECGNTLTASAPVITETPDPLTCEGTRTYTYTYTDCAGNSDTWSFVYTIDVPAFTVPYPNDTETVNCVSDAIDPGSPGDVFDECGNLLIPVITAPNPAGCTGVGAVWTYTYTDCAGNTADWTYTYTIDLAPFTLSFVDNGTTVSCPSDAQIQPTPPSAVTDACGNDIIPVITAPSDVACEGDMAWAFEYVDCAGNSQTWTYTYTVDYSGGIAAPANDGATVSCPSDATDPGAPADITDACGRTVSAVLLSADPLPACEGTVVYTYRYTACDGVTTADWTYTYTIDVPPFTLPFADNGATVNCLADAQVEPTPPAAVTDQCGNTLAPVVSTPADITCEGTMAWVFTYTDCAGNTLDWTYTYTIDLPAFTLPFTDDGLTVECLVDAQVEPVPPAVVTDECGNAITPTVTTPADVPCEGAMAWVFTYTDCAGNSIDWTYTYTIDYTGGITAPANDGLTVECAADAIDPGAPADITDACGRTVSAVLVGSTSTPDPIVCAGTIVWTYRYTACDGTTADWTYTYTIDDTTPPTASNPVDISITSLDPIPAPDLTMVTDEADNCTTNPSVQWVSDVSDNGVCPEIITRTFSVTDDCGNQITVVQLIYIGDAAFPTASDPLPFTVECLADLPAPDPTVVTDEADNGATPIVTWEDDVSDGNFCPETITRRYRVTDDCGNFIFVNQTITIVPTTNPIVPADGASTVNCLADAQVQPAAPVVTDVCGNVLTPVVTVPADITCEGDMTWIFTYTDCAGNISIWNYTYTVDLPVFTLPFTDDAITVNCLVDAQVQPTPPSTVTDVCGNTLTPVITIPTDVVCEGDMAWVFTYTDCAGNTVDWTYTYSIDLPAFTLPFANDGSTVNCLVDAQVQPIPPSLVVDECGNTITPVITTPANVACDGDMNWLFTYTDCAGNTATWEYVYTIIIPAFTITDPAGAETVVCEVNADGSGIVLPAVLDECGNTLTASAPVITDSPDPVTCEGTRTYTYTYTDCAGNTATWEYVYTITVPAFTIPYTNGTAVVNCVADAQADPGAPGDVFDACGNLLTPVITPPIVAGCTGIGADWIYTYTDCAGNTADWVFTYTIDLAPFTITDPAGAETVVCEANADGSGIVLPAVTDACGNAITPSAPVITDAPNPVTCEGTRTYTYTYTDCAGNTATWEYVYTITVPAFTITDPAGAETVVCEANADGSGIVLPTVTDACGNTITPSAPVITDAPNPVTCEGTRTYTYTYTDCAGNTATWEYVYTITVPVFTITDPAGAETVVCEANADGSGIVLPTVTDACGNTLTASAPVITDAPNPVTCEGTRTYTYTYTDCAGNTATWEYVYTITVPAFTITDPAGAETVVCEANADGSGIVLPSVTDACGNTLTASAPVITDAPNPVTCEGTRTYTYTYTDCAGNTATWEYVYTIDLPPFSIGTANGTESLECVADIYVPTPPVVTDLCGNNLVPVMTESADPVCSGQKVYTFTYTDCAGSTGDWTYTFDVNDNIAPTASNPANISVLSAGDVPAPDVTVVNDELDNCDPTPTVTWVNDVSDGNVCNGEQITRTYAIEDDCGNVTLVAQIITITATYAYIDAGLPQTICEGDQVTLTADNPDNAILAWESPVQDGVPFSPSVTDTYTVVANNYGCITSDSVQVTVETVPDVAFIADETIGCTPLTVTFTNTTPGNLDNCSWNFGNGDVSSDCGPVTVVYENGGYYDVTLTTTSINGCVNTVTYNDYIYTEDPPVADFEPSVYTVSNLDPTIEFTNESQGAVDYVWDFGDGSPFGYDQDPTHTYGEDAGSVSVTLYAYSSIGCMDSITIPLLVQEELIYYVPNSFTPDDDQHNQTFQPVFTAGFDPYDFNMLIFNRWGEIVFETNNADIGWDGTYGGEMVQDGTYTWRIEFKKLANDERTVIHGHVNVLR